MRCNRDRVPIFAGLHLDIQAAPLIHFDSHFRSCERTHSGAPHRNAVDARDQIVDAIAAGITRGGRSREPGGAMFGGDHRTGQCARGFAPYIADQASRRYLPITSSRKQDRYKMFHALFDRRLKLIEQRDCALETAVLHSPQPRCLKPPVAPAL